MLKKKWEREFKALEDFSFNYHTVGKGQAVRVEKKYSEWAQQIENLNKIEDKEKRSGEVGKEGNDREEKRNEDNLI